MPLTLTALRALRVLLPALLIAAGVVLAGEAHTTVRLATTTSTENSGLLGYLLPVFERETGLRVQVIAVGTGKALRMAQDGDVDLVLVHAPAAEQQFMNTGAGTLRRAVMHNDFVIVGPPGDRAGIGSLHDAVVAFQRIARSRSTFISRGDDSGTHKKERALWEAAGIRPSGYWYREAGQGMGKVLQMADELQGYTLSDRGTWLAYQGKTDLQLLTEGDPRLFNPYHVIAVNPERYPDVNFAGARALIEWLTGSEGQRLISAYRLRGEQLFHPDALPAVAHPSGNAHG